MWRHDLDVLKIPFGENVEEQFLCKISSHNFAMFMRSLRSVIAYHAAVPWPSQTNYITRIQPVPVVSAVHTVLLLCSI